MNGRRRAIRLSRWEDELSVEAAGLCGLSVSQLLVARAVADAICVRPSAPAAT